MSPKGLWSDGSAGVPRPAGGLYYTTDGSILTLTAGFATTIAERDAVFAAIRADDTIPVGAPLLLDVRGAKGGRSEEDVRERLLALLDGLGPKIRRVCAMVIREDLTRETERLQRDAESHGLRMAIFYEEDAALQWLAPYVTRRRRK